MYYTTTNGQVSFRLVLCTLLLVGGLLATKCATNTESVDTRTDLYGQFDK